MLTVCRDPEPQGHTLALTMLKAGKPLSLTSVKPNTIVAGAHAVIAV